MATNNVELGPKNDLLSGSVSEKFPGQTGSLEFFMALPDKIFCLGLSSHSWPSGKFVYARYARYTNSNALLWLRLSSIDVFCPHFVRAKNWPSGLKYLSSPTNWSLCSERSEHTQICQKAKSGLKALDKKFCQIRP